jgi:hypothetical protein
MSSIILKTEGLLLFMDQVNYELQALLIFSMFMHILSRFLIIMLELRFHNRNHDCPEHGYQMALFLLQLER